MRRMIRNGSKKRDVPVQFYVSRDEKEALERAARLDDRTLSALIRVASLDRARRVIRANTQ